MAVVSIGRSLKEIEKWSDLQRETFECYLSAIRGAAQYAVELDDQLTPPHRSHLLALAETLEKAKPETSLSESRAVLRNQLRDYRDRAAAYLGRLKEELANKAGNLQQIVEAMTASDGDYQISVKQIVTRLHTVSRSPEAAPVRAALESATASLENGLAQIERQHQLTVTQFLVEIQMLHKQIDTLRMAASVDKLTRLASRTEMEARIAAALSKGTRVCLVLLKMRNAASVQAQFGSQVFAELLAVFAKRLRNVLRPETAAGRWDEDAFLCLLAGEKSDAVALAKRISEHAGGTYVCMRDGKAVRPVLCLDVGVVDWAPGDADGRLIQKADQFFRPRPTSG
jgi:diguanylate cyclase (GGDEF)-like protein